MSTTVFRIGTRGSQLALWQAHHVADVLRAHGHAAEIEVIRTTGDRMQDPGFVAPKTADGTPLDAKGIFTLEIEEALLAGRIDLAVHSLKDLPTELEARFRLAAVPVRADARDALVCETFWGLHMLPEGARIGTTSPRRRAMLLALRPDLEFVAMRGNVDTRLRKWGAGEADALVLAAAGLDRLGRTEHVHQRFRVDEICPAPGQGALAIETVAEPAVGLLEALRELDDPDTGFAVAAERGVLAAMGGGCLLPLGAFCHRVDEQWHMHAMVAAPDGEAVAHVMQQVRVGVCAAELAAITAEALKQRGAMEMLAGEVSLEV